MISNCLRFFRSESRLVKKRAIIFIIRKLHTESNTSKQSELSKKTKIVRSGSLLVILTEMRNDVTSFQVN